MPALTPAALRQQIASGATDPLYMLVGEDDVEKSAVAGEFMEMVDEGLRAFNVDRLYGGEMSVDDLIGASATLPMMAPRRLVIVNDAEKLLIPKRESKAAEAEQERLDGPQEDGHQPAEKRYCDEDQDPGKCQPQNHRIPSIRKPIIHELENT